LLIAIFNRSLAGLLLDDESHGGVFLWLAATLVLFVFNAMLLSILNGRKEIGRYVTASITGSLFALLIISWLAVRWGLYGALVGLTVAQSATFFITLYLCCQTNWFRLRYLFGNIDRNAAIKLAGYALMALTSAVSVPLSHVLIRSHLGDTLGWEAAGYWEAMWRLSAAYLMLVTTTLSVYYLPRLSEIREPAELKVEIIQGYKIILPLAAACGLAIYLLRDWIIVTLFTLDFTRMRQLFAWQLTGDTLKIGSWILAFLMLGKAMFKLFVACELIFAGSFFLLAVLLTKFYGLEGVAIAHALNYLGYWVVMGICMTPLLSKK